MPRHDDERELAELLRLSSGAVFVVAFVAIVLAAIFLPDVADRTTLLLGLATSALTAASAMFGVSLLERWRSDD